MNSHLAMPNRARDWAVGAAVGDALRVAGVLPLGEDQVHPPLDAELHLGAVRQRVAPKLLGPGLCTSLAV